MVRDEYCTAQYSLVADMATWNLFTISLSLMGYRCWDITSSKGLGNQCARNTVNQHAVQNGGVMSWSCYWQAWVERVGNAAEAATRHVHVVPGLTSFPVKFPLTSHTSCTIPTNFPTKLRLFLTYPIHFPGYLRVFNWSPTNICHSSHWTPVLGLVTRQAEQQRISPGGMCIYHKIYHKMTATLSRHEGYLMVEWILHMLVAMNSTSCSHAQPTEYLLGRNSPFRQVKAPLPKSTWGLPTGAALLPCAGPSVANACTVPQTPLISATCSTGFNVDTRPVSMWPIGLHLCTPLVSAPVNCYEAALQSVNVAYV